MVTHGLRKIKRRPNPQRVSGLHRHSSIKLLFSLWKRVHFEGNETTNFVLRMNRKLLIFAALGFILSFWKGIALGGGALLTVDRFGVVTSIFCLREEDGWGLLFLWVNLSMKLKDPSFSGPIVFPLHFYGTFYSQEDPLIMLGWPDFKGCDVFGQWMERTRIRISIIWMFFFTKTVTSAWLWHLYHLFYQTIRYEFVVNLIDQRKDQKICLWSLTFPTDFLIKNISLIHHAKVLS